jgi:hypothetical protein
MRPILLALIAVSAATLAGTEPSSAQNRRWCTQSRSGFPICAYDTFEQCRAAASGTGAYCTENPSWTRRRKN